MKNPFEKIFNKQNGKKAALGLAVGSAMLANMEESKAQTGKAEDFIRDNALNPKWNIDMSKYPGMHPAKAFELDSYNKLDLPGKIEFTKQALEAERKNLEIDMQMGEGEEQINKDKEEIRKLEQQLLDLERQGEPAV